MTHALFNKFEGNIYLFLLYFDLFWLIIHKHTQVNV